MVLGDTPMPPPGVAPWTRQGWALVEGGFAPRFHSAILLSQMLLSTPFPTIL